MRLAVITTILATACSSDSGPGKQCKQTVPQFADLDGDGFGDDQTRSPQCSGTAGWSTQAGDCDDTDPSTYPGAVEVCDGLDQDCDGETDEDPADGLQLFADLDGDGYGDIGNSTVACEVGDDWVTDSTDCDDSDTTINPSGADICEQADGNCDGLIDSCLPEGLLADIELDAVWSAASVNDHTGESLAVVGDINGDGYGDAVVGAWGHDLVWDAEQGAAFIHYGGSLDDVELADGPSLTGLDEQDRVGFAVAAAGDVNADGLFDFLVAAPGADHAGAMDAGEVYLFLGDETQRTGQQAAIDHADTIFGLSEPWAEVGTSVAAAGDTNADGFDDFIIGARFSEGAGNARGTVWLLQSDGLGWSPSEPLETHARWDGLSDGDQLGARGSIGAADFNGDGLTDFAVGAVHADTTPGDDRAGAVYVISGRSGIFPTRNTLQDAGTQITGVLVDGVVEFGAAVAGVADADGDGFSDLFVGGPWHDISDQVGETELGAVWLFRGSAVGITATDTTEANSVVHGDESWAWFGQHLTAIGDMDGDGLSDVAIGAYGRDMIDSTDAHTNGGAVFTLPGGLADGTFTASDLPLQIHGTTRDAFVGFGLAGGDLDGDGLSEILIGAPGFGDDGGALLYRGRPR